MTRSAHDIELLTIREVMGIMRMGLHRARRFVKTLPPEAIIRSGRGANGGRILVHGWALHRALGAKRCPSCGQEWPLEMK